MSDRQAEQGGPKPRFTWDPGRHGNAAQIGGVLATILGLVVVIVQISKVSKQMEIAQLTTFNQILSQCLDRREEDRQRVGSAQYYLPSLQAVRLIACFDLIKQLHESHATDKKLPINLAAVDKLSILWEDRLIATLTHDARAIVDKKKSQCDFDADGLERLRMDFVSWYMMVHPRDEQDIEKSFDKEILEHREDLRKGLNPQHADRFLVFVAVLDELRKPCVRGNG